ncbi:zeta toxin family protein [Streptomyces sp. NPDC101776]|uniref:zeta toxin family protein n=1 Tax=Streptomyces sp. NPDC101776 TaxID=3366146 RepID=UPI0037FC726B
MTGRIDVNAARRYRQLEAALRAGHLRQNSPYATVNNPAWFAWVENEPIALPQRRLVQNEIVARELQQSDLIDRSRVAIVTAGPPGAGKSHIENDVRDRLNPGGTWRVVDPDKFKSLLLRQAIEDGSYSSLIPPGLETAHPLELAPLVHEESSALASQIREFSIRQGESVVIDGTLKGREKAERLVSYLVESDYLVHLVDVETTRVISLKRVFKRWYAGYRAAMMSVSSGAPRSAVMGGRWVPSSFVRELFQVGHTSICEQVVEDVCLIHDDVKVQLERWRTNHEDSDPVKEFGDFRRPVNI